MTFDSEIRAEEVAEFDDLADNYRELHQKNIAITGEPPEYFSEYKIADIAALFAQKNLSFLNILDFGSGTGNSLPYFRKYFPSSKITCADVSPRCMEVAQARFPGEETYVQIKQTLPLPDSSQDLVFAAGVFHHIPFKHHAQWLNELYRVTKPNGILIIYEHNPLNPLTVHAVKTCPLDVNANLIKAKEMRQKLLSLGWLEAEIAYKVFFPAWLAFLRPLEQRLEWLGLGAQYRIMASKY